MNGWIWGLIGVLVSLVCLGIPIGYGIKLLLQQILTLLKSVKSVIDSVQETITNVNTTVLRMSEFIDRNDRQHNEIRSGLERVNDNINTQSNRIVDAVNVTKR